MIGEKVSQRETPSRSFQTFVALLCVVILAPGDGRVFAQQPPAAAPAEQGSKIPADQLDSLVAPIALYPDPMLSQTLVASTYPLEIIQLQQWLETNPGLKDQALADAVKNQGWDPSIQAMAALPDVVKQLAENIKWTADLGNAFLVQQEEVMQAVQRMRQKALDAGTLKSSEQQKVETKVVETKTVVVIEQANPQVVYVPSYNPVVVYGPPVYPYPPIYYPPPGYYAAGMAISFGVGVAMGAFWGGGWGYGCGWGHNDIDINIDNNFVRNDTNINRSGNRTNVGNTKWEHNPQHRGGAPYSDRATASKYGGTARGDSLANRQATARQNQARNRPQAGTMDRGAGGRAQAGTMDRGASGRTGSNRGASPSAGNMSANRGSGGDRVGNRQTSTSSSSSGGSRSAFGGASSGMSGHSTRASSSRGASSMSSSRGGSSRGGGGGRRR